MLTPIVEKQRLGAAFSFIVARARTDRVDVSPIVFGLRMYARIAVDLRGRCLHDFGLHPLGETQHIDGAMHTGLGRLHWIVLVMYWRSRASQIVNFINLKINRKR